MYSPGAGSGIGAGIGTGKLSCPAGIDAHALESISPIIIMISGIRTKDRFVIILPSHRNFVFMAYLAFCGSFYYFNGKEL